MQLHVISVTRLLNTSHLPEGVCTIPQQLLKHKRNPLHAGYTFTNTEGLVNDLLQDHSIAIEKAACRLSHNSVGE